MHLVLKCKCIGLEEGNKEKRKKKEKEGRKLKTHRQSNWQVHTVQKTKKEEHMGWNDITKVRERGIKERENGKEKSRVIQWWKERNKNTLFSIR